MFAVATSTVNVLAEDKSESDRLAKIVAPYLDGQTLVVAHLDLMAFDALPAVDVLAKLTTMPDQQRNNLQAQVVPINVISQSTPAGTAIDVFVVAGLADARGCLSFSVCHSTPRRPPTRFRQRHAEISRKGGGGHW